MLLADTLLIKGTDPKIEEEIICKVLDEELSLASVPKTTDDFPAGLSIPRCTHLGKTEIGTLSSNLMCDKCECAGCTSSTYLNNCEDTKEVHVGDTAVSVGSKEICMGDISRDLSKLLATSECTEPLVLATETVAEFKLKVD